MLAGYGAANQRLGWMMTVPGQMTKCRYQAE